MMNTRPLKVFISFSFAGHAAIISALALLNFSFASVPGRIPFKPAVYCGIMPPEFLSSVLTGRPPVIAPRVDPALAPFPVSTQPVSLDPYIKPSVVVSCVEQREFLKSPPIQVDVPKRNDSVLMLHPLLPYQFDLYFKDRQAVHIELEFAITHADNRNFVSLRRKISSGNLEADLLSMRYIGHYLFIQQARFMPATWQTVKIEFSPNTR